VEIEPGLRAKATALGAEGERWLDDELPRLLAELAAEWHLTIGEPLTGGAAGYLVGATTSTQRDVVLKLCMPDGLHGNAPFEHELRALLLGQGPGWVEVIEHDLVRRALLLERLGRPLRTLGHSVEEQIEIIARTVPITWRVTDGPPPLATGAEKADMLASFIADLWDATGRTWCAEATVDAAVAACTRRRDAFDPTSAVFIHGDVHGGNVLEASDGSDEFKLIDPEGMISEPAHDIAIPLRSWNVELLAAAATDGELRQQALAWCEAIAEPSGTDPASVWEWATIERVSTGLFLASLGHAEEARTYLEVADRLAR
jgi:streptomycin 6-kinase